jgi:hypothetical protein
MTANPAWLDTLDRVEERLALRRTVLLAVTVWLTWRSFQWANDYAEIVLAANSDGATLGAAAIIAAVTMPISVLQGYVFKAYIESKQ